MKVILIAILSLFVYPKSFPVTQIMLEQNQSLEYQLKFDLDLQARNGNQTSSAPSSIDVVIPFKVISLTDSSYILETKSEDIVGSTSMYDPENDQMLELDISQIFGSTTFGDQIISYEIDKKGNIISSDLSNSESPIVGMLDYFSIYSGGFFVSLPKGKSKEIWKKTLTTVTNTGSMAMDFVIDQNFKYVGQEDFQDAQYHKVNYFVDNVKFDNPIMKMMDAKMDSQIAGFFLVDDNGIVKLSSSKGKITLSADLNKLSGTFNRDEAEYDPNKVMGFVINVSSRMVLK